MNRDELTDLAMRFIDGRATDEEATALSLELAANAESRRSYLRLARLHAALATEEDQLAEVVPLSTAHPAPAGFKRWVWAIGAMAAVAAIAFLFHLRGPPASPDGPEIVATFGEMRDCRWVSAGENARPGDAVTRGQRLQLSSGSAVLRFTSGAVVTLLGPCIFEATSGNGASSRWARSRRGPTRRPRRASRSTRALRRWSTWGPSLSRPSRPTGRAGSMSRPAKSTCCSTG